MPNRRIHSLALPLPKFQEYKHDFCHKIWWISRAVLGPPCILHSFVIIVVSSSLSYVLFYSICFELKLLVMTQYRFICVFFLLPTHHAINIIQLPAYTFLCNFILLYLSKSRKVELDCIYV